MARDPRAAARLRREGRARGRRARRLVATPTRRSRSACTRSSTPCSTTSASPRSSTVSSPRSRRRAGRTRSRAKLLQLTGAGRARRLPGQRAVGAPRSSTPTTAAPSTSTSDAGCSPSWTRRRARCRRRRRDAARRSCSSPRGRCACGATGPSCSREYTPMTVVGAAADHAIAFDRGGALTVATRLPVGLAARGGWGDTVVAAAARADRSIDVLTGRTLRRRDAPARRRCCATYPVALLAPARRRDVEVSARDRGVGAAGDPDDGCSSTARGIR